MECYSNGVSLTELQNRPFSILIDSRIAGIRLDQFLSQYFPSISRNRISISIHNGLITVGGISRKNSYRLKPGETVTGSLFELPAINVLPEKVPFTVLFEDDHLILLSKPPGIVVHPGSGNHQGTLVSGLVYHCQAISAVGDKLRPGIVHRLDKDTSGIMVVAKSDFVLRKLAELFKNRYVKKNYIALLHGTMKKKSGRLVASIGRHPVNRQKMAVLPEKGRHAVSNWQVLEELAGTNTSLVKIGIETGRTHQIRVHMAHLGHPVVGDRVYGSNRNNVGYPRQFLHAHRLVLRHPVTNEILDQIAPLWQDFAAVLRGHGLEKWSANR